jgi:hypothetical protein
MRSQYRGHVFFVTSKLSKNRLHKKIIKESQKTLLEKIKKQDLRILEIALIF